MVMFDPERIHELIARLGERSGSFELARKMRCGGKKFDGGGKFLRTNLENEKPLMYDPEPPSVPYVPVPVRYEPLPHYGLYEYPSSTGIAESYPVNVGYSVPVPGYGVVEPVDAVYSGMDPVKDAARRIMAVENSKTNPDGGWNEKEQRWYPHRSVEGGADTIAYGIKLSNGTPEAKLALEQGYLTDEQATRFADTLARRYYDAARRVYDKKYGEGEWDKLSDWSQSILTDFSYNPGLGKYPKLMEGFHSGDMDTILSEYKRYSGGQELGRNKIIREELDTLGTDHPIFRAEGGRLFDEGGGEYPTSSTRSYLRGLSDYVLRRKAPHSFVKSEYRPTVGDEGETYYTRPGLKNEVALNLFGGTDFGKGVLGSNYFYKDFDDAYNSISGHPMNRDMRATSNGTLGQYSVTSGADDRGRYLSFTDKFDHIFIPGEPIHIYDRIYEDEVPLLYNAGDSAIGLGDVLSRSPLLKDMKASGGKIHIKPENRGKFTALKKRTGHSASWFKAHGTPAQKKMAVFALNAKKWKHGDGGFMDRARYNGDQVDKLDDMIGFIHRYDGDTEPTGQMDRVPNWRVKGSDYSMWSPSDIQEIINWGVTDPSSFFGEEGRDTREAINRAGMTKQVIGGVYDLLPRHQQWLYGYEYAPEKEKEEAFAQGIRNYRDTKGLGFTIGALSVPLSIMGGAEAAAGAGWLAAHPAQSMAIGKFLAPMVGMGMADTAFQKYTPWDSWGQAIGDVSGIHSNPLYQYGLGDWGKGFVDAGLELAHPAFMLPYEKAATGIANAIGRSASRRQARNAAREFRTLLRDMGRAGSEPYVMPGEPAEAFAVDTGPQAQKSLGNRGPSSVPAAEQARASSEPIRDPLSMDRFRAWTRQATEDDLVAYRDQLPIMQQYGQPGEYPDEMYDIIENELSSRRAALPFDVQVNAPRTTSPVPAENPRRRMPDASMTDYEFEDWLQDEATYEDLSEFIRSMNSRSDGGASAREWLDQAEFEMQIRRNAGYLDGFGRPPRRVGEAPTARETSTARETIDQGAGLSRSVPERRVASASAEANRAPAGRYTVDRINGMSDDDVIRLARDVNNGDARLGAGDVAPDELYGIVRKRGQAKIFNGKTDIADLSDRELVSVYERNYSNRDMFKAIDMANTGVPVGSEEYMTAQKIRDKVGNAMRERIRNSGYYTDMDTAIAHMDMARSLGDWRISDEVATKCENIISKYIIDEKNIPNDFVPMIPGIVRTLFDNGHINEGNKYMKDAIAQLEEQFKNVSNQKLANRFFSIGSSATDDSAIAASQLRRHFSGVSDNDLLKMLDTITPQMVQGDAPVPIGKEDLVRIVRSAYSGPSKYSSMSRYEDFASGKLGDMLKKRLSDKGIDIDDLSVVFDVKHPDYVETARKLRKAGISLLPADVKGMAMNEMVLPKRQLFDGTYDNMVLGMLGNRTVTDDAAIAFVDDFDRLSKKNYGKKLSELKNELVDRSALNQKLQQYWNEIRANFRRGLLTVNEKQAPLLLNDEYDTKMWINFRDEFQKMFANEYGKPREAVEESLLDYSAYNDRLNDLWSQIRSEYNNVYALDEGKKAKYIRKHAESLMSKDLGKARAAAGVRQKLLDLAIPRQAGVAEHSASVQSYKSQITGAAKGIRRGTYGTDAYQTAIMPLDEEYGRMDSGYLTGNNYQENRVVYDIDGTLRNYGNPEMDASLESFFNKKEFDNFLKNTDRMSDRDFINYIQNDQDAKNVVEQILAINRMLDKHNVQEASSAISKVNAVNGPFYGDIGLPRPEHEIPESVEEMIQTHDPWSIKRLINNSIYEFSSTGGGFGGPGYATYMHRTPIIVLRHKYGGMLDRMSSVYKNDRDSMILAIQNARKRRMK